LEVNYGQGAWCRWTPSYAFSGFKVHAIVLEVILI
jgi:hypothetical protein